MNPKNLLLSAGAGAAVAGLALPTTEAVVSLAAFLIIASLTIAVPVIYYLVGGQPHARASTASTSGSACTTTPS